ncbi:ABC transporter substrate-binding protein [Bradyrhizobium uaiense]|uniref:ABC transporter substrate-binding protein n=1 Tax=Bradyrhizobium uaiense TaxID=2594946 RepID=A0A6P1BM10_9BRAD|nr:ABC transporter substrate-binding protein [Bradyrhizobium uaiense]NEU98651.1 ABC transporter substrate-binding protein [Bradyrhizobium uaiense]
MNVTYGGTLPARSLGSHRLRSLLWGLVAFGAAGLLFSAPAVRAEDTLKIGVLTDESGPYADASGAGAILAAEMAAEDFGTRANGRKIEVVHADTQNKPDVALAIARRWFDRDNVSAVVDLPVTPVAYAVQQLAKQSNRTVMITASAASEFTSKNCSLVSTHWADDTHALAAGTAKRLMADGPADWFFITVDISFGAALQRDATQVIERAGGKVLGSTKHPPNNPDFASQLLQAQASGARYIGLASVGGDLVNLLKQAKEFGIGQDGKQSLIAFLVYITDIHSLGLQVSQGLTVTSGFYWDQSEAARTFAKRFFAKRQAMPTKDQAEIYAAVTHYLKAVDAAKTDEASAVNRQMREMPLDYFGTPASLRGDGRLLYDLGLYRVKSPSASKSPWDYYERIGTISRTDAFLDAAPGCTEQ